MKVTFDWKQLSKEQPECHKYVIIYTNRKNKVKWFFGFYNGFNTLGVKPTMYHYYEFDATKIDLDTFTKQSRVTRQVLKADAPMCYWDYYNPYWKAPNSFDAIEDFFYKL